MAASLGYDTIGGSTENFPQNYCIVCKFTASASFNCSSIIARITGGNGSTKVRGTLRNDNAGVPGTEIITGTEVTIANGAAAAWVTLSITTQAIVNTTVYWLGYWTNEPNGTPASIAYDAGSAGQESYQNTTYATSGAYGTFTSGGTNARKLSIYATVDPVVALASNLLLGVG